MKTKEYHYDVEVVTVVRVITPWPVAEARQLDQAVKTKLANPKAVALDYSFVKSTISTTRG